MTCVTLAIVTSSCGHPPSAGGDTLSAQMDQARIQGNPSAKVWFVLVSDFQCPYCKQFHDQSFATIEQQYVATGKVRLAYINYPLPSHINAWPAAETAMCAAAQGKFWQIHDALFASQSLWAEKRPATAVLDSIAHSVGVDTVGLDKCVTGKTVHDLIDADHDRAERAGVNATPTIIIGQTVMPGAQPAAVYQHVLDSALAAAK
jgi:protein-disulfide isomerase